MFAFRYSLGRKTYAPSLVISEIKINIKQFTEFDIVQIIKEINECENYGDDFDKTNWLNFKKYLENYLDEIKIKE